MKARSVWEGEYRGSKGNRGSDDKDIRRGECPDTQLHPNDKD